MNFRGCRTKPGPKPSPKIGTDQAARPLAGGEVLVAVVGPSPGEGGGKFFVFPIRCFKTSETPATHMPLTSAARDRNKLNIDL